MFELSLPENATLMMMGCGAAIRAALGRRYYSAKGYLTVYCAMSAAKFLLSG